MSFQSLALKTSASCAALALGGCVIMTPSPAIEMLQMTIATASGLVSLTPVTAQDVVTHQYPTPHFVCIELNPNAPDPDLVPGIQAEIQTHKIDSRVYGQGGAPTDCESVLSYSAVIAWERPVFSDDYRSYLREATMTLRASGKVLASASYRTRDWGSGKWSSTRSKIAPVIDALLTGKLK